MITFEEYEREHNPKMSKTEIIIGLVLLVSFLAYFVFNAIVDCWPLLRSNLAAILSQTFDKKTATLFFLPQAQNGSFSLYTGLAISLAIFSDMTTYSCHTLEDALKRAKAAGKRPGCFYGGTTLKSGKIVFAIYREGKVIEHYSVIGGKE